ncbi:uncharacterized protein [Prorops nasuta]|uniref:uncharacterized protein n=1 Tax=Prorops nasuta TaxID=863751 RepID=UPI0034CDDFF2
MTNHTCEKKDLLYKEQCKFRNLAFEVITNTPCTSKEAYDHAAKSCPFGAESIPFKKINYTLNKWKKKKYPKSPKNIKLLEATLNSSTKFMQFKVGNRKDKIEHYIYKEDKNISFIFYNKKMVKCLRDAQTISVDGTFDVTPKSFPIVWILMNKKTESAYRGVLNFVKFKILNKMNPVYVHCDFEKAIQNSVKTIFPETVIKGCYFHYIHVRNIR